MAHQLYTDKNGKTSFSYVGEHAWHNLGQQLTPNSPLAVWEVEAGFNWTIERGPCQTPHGEDLIVMPDRHLLYRSDTLAPLAVVSDKYKLVQPAEVLHFYEDLIESAGFTLETAGILFGGRRFWALARTNYTDQVLTGDAVSQYLLLTSACDGSLATTAKFTSVRVVCNNTATIALNERGLTTVKVPHSANFDPDKVKQALGVAGSAWATWLTTAKQLATRELTKNESILFLRDLIGDPSKSLEDQTPAAANVMQSIYQLYDTDSRGNELVGHTAWGMFNAVTEYYDWYTGHKTADARMNNAWFGDGDKTKSAAFDQLSLLVA